MSVVLIMEAVIKCVVILLEVFPVPVAVVIL